MKISNLVFLKIPVISVLITLFITSNVWKSPAAMIPDSGPIVYWLRPILVSYTYALAIWQLQCYLVMEFLVNLKEKIQVLQDRSF